MKTQTTNKETILAVAVVVGFVSAIVLSAVFNNFAFVGFYGIASLALAVATTK